MKMLDPDPNKNKNGFFATWHTSIISSICYTNFGNLRRGITKLRYTRYRTLSYRVLEGTPYFLLACRADIPEKIKKCTK